MSGLTRYDVYDGNRLFLEKVTRREMEEVFDQHITNLTTYIDEGIRFRGRYTIRYSDCMVESGIQQAGWVSEWSSEWDRVRLAIQRRVEWVTDGGRKITLSGRS